MNATGLDSGCISASDLSVLPGLITTTPRANDATHISKEHAGGAKDPAVQSTDGNVSLTLRDLYEKITASLSQSICYLLARERHFLQIGSPTCLDARTLGDSAFDVLDVGSLQPESITMTCKVQWLSSGSLWIYLSMDPIVRLCTVRHALQKLGESAKLIEGDAILLSPSGLVGQYHGMEKTPRSHPSYGLVTSVKSRISAWLTQREEQLDDGTQWVYVSFGGNCARGISKKSLAHEVKRTFSLWPAHLCLCRDASSATVMPSESLCVDPSNDSLGPLERAQAWFLGKDARKEAIEADQCREIAEAARSSAVDDLDEDDLMTSPRYHVSQGVTPQDLTGIYPTPPDGIPPIVHDAFTNFNSQQDSITDRPTTAIADEDVDRQGGRPGNEELFGGMDIDTFATNGLTEDDFNFFDEPDIIIHDDNNFGVDRSPIATPMAAGTAVQMTDKDVTSPYDIASVRQVANPDSSCEVPDVGQHLSLVLPDSSGDTSTEAAVTVVPASSNKFLCDKDIINMLDEGDKDGVVEDAVPKYSPFQKDTLLPDYRQLRERSFGNVYFPDLASTFDEKYALSGRYGFSPPNLPDPSTSLQKSIRVPNGPPESGVTDPEESRLRSQMSTDRALTQLGHANWTNTTQSVGDTDEEDYTPPSPRSSDSDNEEATQTLLERPHDTMSWTSSEDDRRPVTPLSSGPAPKTSEQPKLLDPFQEEILCFPDNNEQVHVYLKAHLGSAMTEASPVGRNDRNFVQVAQMVVDQAISRVNRPQDSDHHRSMQDLQAAHSSQLLHQIIATWSSRFGKNSKQCSLKDFLCLDGQDLQSSTRDQEMMKKPLQPIRPSAAGQTVTKLPSPFTCVQRSGTHIDIAAPALRFWEELSLAPCHDSKDVVAFCLYPTGLCIQDELHTFLAMMRSTYQSCKLGIHELGCGPSKFPDGLVPLPMDVRNPNYDLPEIYQACEDFGSWLGKLGLQGRNIIVYMLDPLDNGAAAPLLCAAFLRIFNMYSKVIKDDGNGEPSDLVLQIVPSRIVYSEVGIAIASPLDYRKLAFEVYDRCGPSKCDGKDATQSFVGAPSMRLAKAVPRAIDLRLTPDNAPLSLQSDKCLHIAYAWSPGEPWLTASWIDNLGLLSWTACYGFGDEDSVLWRSFSEIANEIWQTTLELLQPRSGPWRLLLCKDGAVHKQELDGEYIRVTRQWTRSDK